MHYGGDNAGIEIPLTVYGGTMRGAPRIGPPTAPCSAGSPLWWFWWEDVEEDNAQRA